MSHEIRYTLITGGSSGIGRAFSRESARRGRNCLIVALPGAELEESAAELRSDFGVRAEALAVDLTDHDGPLRVHEWCRTRDYAVNTLINNAGLAGAGIFADSSLGSIDARVQLNVRALVLLTRLFLPDLKKFQSSGILNIGSMAAFYPIPYKSDYAASKAFVVTFSQALSAELGPSGIAVSVLCPNGVRTNPGTQARIDSHGWKGRWLENTPEELARLGLDGLARGKALIIPGWRNRLVLAGSRLLPRPLVRKLLTREFRKELKA